MQLPMKAAHTRNRHGLTIVGSVFSWSSSAQCELVDHGRLATPPTSYPQRTEWNVRDSEGTVIFTVAAEMASGSKRTAGFAKKHVKPWLRLSKRGSYESAGERLPVFIREHEMKVLKVGPAAGA